jgi:cytochrome c-type biogenesis protein CcmE
MNALRKKKLFTLFVVLSTLAVVFGLVLYALRQNISLFYTPTEIAQGAAPRNQSIRLGGMVVSGSVVRNQDLTVKFQITDNHETISVKYHGVLPDLFNEGKGVVAQGLWMGKRHFNASTVLAKHDENYMPSEVKQALEKSKQSAQGGKT